MKILFDTTTALLIVNAFSEKKVFKRSSGKVISSVFEFDANIPM